MTLCALKDKECVDFNVFREKEEMALAKNEIFETKKPPQTHKTPPVSFSPMTHPQLLPPFPSAASLN